MVYPAPAQLLAADQEQIEAPLRLLERRTGLTQVPHRPCLFSALVLVALCELQGTALYLATKFPRADYRNYRLNRYYIPQQEQQEAGLRNVVNTNNLAPPPCECSGVCATLQ